MVKIKVRCNNNTCVKEYTYTSPLSKEQIELLEFPIRKNYAGVYTDLDKNMYPKTADNIGTCPRCNNGLLIKIKSSNINHPSHYNSGKFEVIDVIEDWKLGFNLGNALKYIGRAEHKGTKVDDLNKAIWYIQRELNKSI